MHPPPPLPPCLRFLEGVVFSTWWNNNPVMDMKEKSGVFQWKKVVRFIMFCKSSYAESYFVVVLLFFPGWKEGKHSGKCNRVCFGWWNKIKNKKDSQRMHRKKRMHSRIYFLFSDLWSWILPKVIKLKSKHGKTLKKGADFFRCILLFFP